MKKEQNYSPSKSKLLLMIKGKSKIEKQV